MIYANDLTISPIRERIMRINMLKTLNLLCAMFLFTGVATAQEFPEMDWDDLVPSDFRADAILDKYGDFSELPDEDPRVQEIMQELEAAFKAAPIVESLDGKNLKLPGFVVPLEADGEKVSEFLLVPYYGACIHVPPPPANQTIYVKVPENQARKMEVFETVWVSGTLSAKSFDSDLATAGYQIEAVNVEPLE